MLSKLIQFDTWLFHFINSKLKCRFLDMIMPYCTHVGGVVLSVGICLSLMIWVPQVPGTRILGSVFMAQVLAQSIKFIIKRLRPHIAMTGVNVEKELLLYDPSFPSAHTATITAWGTVLATFISWTAPIVILACFLVGFSRIYLGQHFPFDVLVGAVIGVGSGVLVSAL